MFGTDTPAKHPSNLCKKFNQSVCLKSFVAFCIGHTRMWNNTGRRMICLPSKQIIKKRNRLL
jgi:hypothetical protein